MLNPQIFAIYGDPVAHSRSPIMHNYVFYKMHYPALYTRIRLIDGTKLRQDFFDRGLSGANITVPHKEAAYQACDEIRGFAQKVGVVNTIVKEGDKLIGYNTDADGFIYAMQSFKAVKKILVLGAGGTAKALVQKLLDEGYAVTVVNRSQARLDAFSNLCPTFTWETFKIDAYDLILNTTSAGLSDDTYPLDKAVLETLLSQAAYAADVIYGKQTPFLTLAQAHKLQTIDGQAMLIGQGVLANRLFTQEALNQNQTLKLMQKSFEL